MPEGLQLIIGVDKRNPVFSIYKNELTHEVYVFYGGELLEVIQDTKDNPELKLMLARLYKAKVKVKTLIEHFGYSYPTIHRWAEALKSGNAERLYEALSGQGAPRKLTSEIESFIELRFASIYHDNKYSYSAQIRQEIEDVFGKKISGETLRPLFGRLRKGYGQSTEKTNHTSLDFPESNSGLKKI